MTHPTQEVAQTATDALDDKLALTEELLHGNALVYCSLIMDEAPTVKCAGLLLLGAARSIAADDAAAEAEVIALMREYIADYDAASAEAPTQ